LYEINCGRNTVTSGRRRGDVLIFESNDELLHSKNGMVGARITENGLSFVKTSDELK